MSHKFSIAKNAEGYTDPTAFTALKATIKAEKEKSKMEVYAGDICWFKQTVSQNERLFIVLNTNGKSSVGLQLCDDDRLPYAIKVQSVMYTNPMLVTYAYNDNATNYVRSLSSDEMAELLEAVVKALGYKPPVASKPAIQTKPAEPAKVSDASVKLAEVSAERNIYKNLYEQLLNSVIGK